MQSELTPFDYDLIDRIYDFLDNQSDASYEGEEMGYVPNEALRLKTELSGMIENSKIINIRT